MYVQEALQTHEQ